MQCFRTTKHGPVRGAFLPTSRISAISRSFISVRAFGIDLDDFAVALTDGSEEEAVKQVEMVDRRFGVQRIPPGSYLSIDQVSSLRGAQTRCGCLVRLTA